MPLLQTRRLIFCIFITCTLLQSCASTEKHDPSIKIGMHIDAVMEFVVEYPLSWSKDRRLIYGSKEGEIRWTSPNHPNTLIRVESFMQAQKDLSIEDQITQSLHDYVGLKISSKQKVTLPAGEAWYIQGETAQFKVDIYLFLRTDRSYLLALTTPPEKRESCGDVMTRFTQSFQTMPL